MTFEGIAENDRYLSPSASVTWTLSKHISLGLDYRHIQFLSDVTGVPGFQKKAGGPENQARRPSSNRPQPSRTAVSRPVVRWLSIVPPPLVRVRYSVAMSKQSLLLGTPR